MKMQNYNSQHELMRWSVLDGYTGTIFLPSSFHNTLTSRIQNVVKSSSRNLPTCSVGYILTQVFKTVDS